MLWCWYSKYLESYTGLKMMSGLIFNKTANWAYIQPFYCFWKEFVCFSCNQAALTTFHPFIRNTCFKLLKITYITHQPHKPELRLVFLRYKVFKDGFQAVLYSCFSASWSGDFRVDSSDKQHVESLWGVLELVWGRIGAVWSSI